MKSTLGLVNHVNNYCEIMMLMSKVYYIGVKAISPIYFQVIGYCFLI